MSTEPYRQAEIEKILLSLVRDGSYISAVVASSDGLPLAMVGQANTDMIAAVAASMKALAERAQNGLTEITTRDDYGEKIVSRYFAVDDDLLLLAVKMPVNRTYRRLTGQAINAIKNVWQS